MANHLEGILKEVKSGLSKARNPTNLSLRVK